MECPIKGVYLGSNRCDVLFFNGYLIIIEVKFKETVESALKQVDIGNYLEIAQNRKVIEDLNKIKYHVCFAIAATMKLKILVIVEQMCVEIN